MNASSSRRKAREAALRALRAQLQREIDASRSLLWNRYFHESARINPHGSSASFSTMFDECWRRTMLPNSERTDMDADGNYVTAA